MEVGLVFFTYPAKYKERISLSTFAGLFLVRYLKPVRILLLVVKPRGRTVTMV